MTTPILEIPEISGSQINQYITANEAFRSLEAAANDFLSVSLASANVTLTNAQFAAAFMFVATGNTVARVLTIPQKKRNFIVRNSGSADLTVTRGTSTVTILAADSVEFVTDGTANGLFRVGSAAGGGGVTGFVTGKNTATPNATVPVCYIAVDDAAANVDLALQTKGTGALILGVPDNAATVGGNKRGANAIDIQQERTAATQVASGANAVAIGRRCTSSNSSSTAIGFDCLGSGIYAVSMGGSTSVTGNYSVGIGYTISVTGDYSVSFGANCSTNAATQVAIGRFAHAGAIIGNHAYSNDRFSVDGDSQKTSLVLRRSTSNATATVLATNGSAGSAANQKTLVNNSLVTFRGRVSARQNTTGDSAAWEFSGAIKRGANAASTALLSAVTPVLIGADTGAAAWALTVTADATTGCLKIEATGEASKTIRWVCVLDCCEVVG